MTTGLAKGTVQASAEHIMAVIWGKSGGAFESDGSSLGS